MTEDSGSEQSRSERLRQRRSKRNELPRKTTTPDDDLESSASVDADTGTAGTTATTSDDSINQKSTVREEQVGTYMYIPEWQKKEIQRQYNVLKAEYEYEFEDAFEKNRHFYPLLVQYGLDSLDGLDAMEIQDMLDSI